MGKFTCSTIIQRSAEKVFAWHEQPGAFERLAPPWQKVELASPHAGIRDGAKVHVISKLGPFRLHWHIVHRDYISARQFCDEQISGPFSRWRHQHLFEADGSLKKCRLTDHIEYSLPGGILAERLAAGFVKKELGRLFAYRHEVTRADNELAAGLYSVRRLKIIVAGASGLVGSALVPFLRTQGHDVFKLVRHPAVSPDEIAWDPSTGTLAPEALLECDAVINLAGTGIATGRWTSDQKQKILGSRIAATKTLVAAIEGIQSEKKRPRVLLSASASGIYGDRGDELVNETASGGFGFLAEVCRAWEEEADKARSLGLRVVRLRTGVVLTPRGGALAKMLPAFKWGFGGPLGHGKQWLSWIGMDDMIGAIYHALLHDDCLGAVNLCSPEPIRQADFAQTLGQILRRPSLLPAPAFALKWVFGSMAEDTILASTRMSPDVLLSSGYRFRHEKLDDALRHTLGVNRVSNDE